MQLNHPVRKMILQEATGETILDSGCATCIDYDYFKGSNKRYVGIDVTPKFTKAAREYNPKVDIILGDILNLPLRSKVLGTAYCKDVLEHLPPSLVESIIKETWEATNERMMIVFFNAPTTEEPLIRRNFRGFYVNRYNKENIVKILKNLESFKSLQVTENIGYTRSSLYIVDKARGEEV